MAIRVKQNLPESDIQSEYTDPIATNNVRRIKALIKHKLKPHKNCLYQAFRYKHKNLIPLLLDAGADPNEFASGGWWTIMGECIEKSDAATLSMVLSRGADPNLSYKGLHSLIFASRVGDIEVFRLLVDAGARLFTDPRLAPNALFEAVVRGHKEIVKFLIERGVDFTSRKPFGKTAIEFADEKGMAEIRDLLQTYKKNKATKTKSKALPKEII